MIKFSTARVSWWGWQTLHHANEGTLRRSLCCNHCLYYSVRYRASKCVKYTLYLLVNDSMNPLQWLSEPPNEEFHRLCPSFPHWIITRVHQFKYQICKNVEQPWENQFGGSFPSTFHKGPKGPPTSPCPAPWPIYWSERRGRKGEKWPSRRRRSKVWEGMIGQMCPNPTHLRRSWRGREGSVPTGE